MEIHMTKLTPSQIIAIIRRAELATYRYGR